jgi:threonine/homoserine/homoserine lactone efflux protein
VTALGNTTASFLQATLAIVGLGTILSLSGGLFLVIKWLGAAYLIYVGIKMWHTSSMPSEIEDETDNDTAMGQSKMFWKAFFVAAGNPKAIVFFTALFPQFINANAHQFHQYIILVMTLSVVAFFSFMIYAFGGNQIGWLLKQPKARKYFNRIIGGVFIGIGINLATSKS